MRFRQVHLDFHTSEKIAGIGSKFITAINDRDYTMIMATTVFLAVIMVVANLLSDLLYKAVDPRIQLE